jgi:hypothetical protein
MRNTLMVAMTLLAAAASNSSAADIDVMSRPHVRVRIYDTTGLDAASRAAALATAAAILQRAGLTVTWLACPPQGGATAADACETPLRRTDLAIRFVRGAAGARASRVALGHSLVDTRARTGSLATIFIDRVEQLAAGTAAGCNRLIGRALAHEIGHLLLGTTAHAPSGLMTAVWSRDVLAREQDEDWWFTERDARALREAVRSRAVQQLSEVFRAAQLPADRLSAPAM